MKPACCRSALVRVLASAAAAVADFCFGHVDLVDRVAFVDSGGTGLAEVLVGSLDLAVGRSSLEVDRLEVDRSPCNLVLRQDCQESHEGRQGPEIVGDLGTGLVAVVQDIQIVGFAEDMEVAVGVDFADSTELDVLTAVDISIRP